MTHRPAAFAALLGLTRARSAIGDFWIHGVNGAFQLDSWHHGWETVAALVATTKATTR